LYSIRSAQTSEEQHFLDILFSLPANLRYNFSPVAGAPIAGRTHSEETLAQMRDSHTGKTHSEETRAQISDSISGKTHSEETRAQISKSQQLVDRSGANNPMYGRTGANHPSFGKSHSDETRAKMSEALTGANNPMFGKSGELSPVSIQVNVYSLDNVLVRSFSSQVACAKWLGVSEGSVRNYIRSGKVFKGLYRLSNSLLS
jgi:hypothetical protein